MSGQAELRDSPAVPRTPLTLFAVAGRAVRGRAGALPLAPHRQLLAGQARLLLQLALRGGSGMSAGGRRARGPVPAAGAAVLTAEL